MPREWQSHRNDRWLLLGIREDLWRIRVSVRLQCAGSYARVRSWPWLPMTIRGQSQIWAAFSASAPHRSNDQEFVIERVMQVAGEAGSVVNNS